MTSDLQNIVLCISFGHSSEQVSTALRGATVYAQKNPSTKVIVVDDCSGHPPTNVEGATILETPTRRGFAGAVNFVLDSFPDVSGRLLLINPDASVSAHAVSDLLSFDGGVAVPQVLNPHGEVENVRKVTTASEQVLALILGEKLATRISQRQPVRSGMISCPPYAPSGSVMAYPIQFLRDVPLRAEFFWLEQSDWIIRFSALHGPVQVKLLPLQVSHTGASTSLRYPVSVAASQLRTKINFILEYGGFFSRLLVPLGVILRSLRFLIKTRQPHNAWFLVKVAAGLADWRVSK